jgi:translation initiation factor 1 (eIF-1/SUI1)
VRLQNRRQGQAGWRRQREGIARIQGARRQDRYAGARPAAGADELAALGKQLRSACGSGGTVKDGVLEIQGDHCERVMAELTKLGHKPKRTGG